MHQVLQAAAASGLGRAHAGRDLHVEPLQEHRLLDRGHQGSRRPRERPPAGRLTEQRRELVTAQAGHRVPGAQHGLQARGDRRQQDVPGAVAEAVVDGREPVEVEEQHLHGIAAALLEGGLDRVREGAPVGQAGQVVVVCPVLQLHLERLPLGEDALQLPHQDGHPAHDEQEQQRRRAGDGEDVLRPAGPQLVDQDGGGDQRGHDERDEPPDAGTGHGLLRWQREVGGAPVERDGVLQPQQARGEEEVAAEEGGVADRGERLDAEHAVVDEVHDVAHRRRPREGRQLQPARGRPQPSPVPDDDDRDRWSPPLSCGVGCLGGRDRPPVIGGQAVGGTAATTAVPAGFARPAARWTPGRSPPAVRHASAARRPERRPWLTAMPATTTAAPSGWFQVTVSPRTTAPSATPTTGVR